MASRVEDREATVQQDKSMARLAKALEAEGVKGVWFSEGECCQLPRLSYKSGKHISDVEDIAVSLGYTILRLHDTWDRTDREKEGISRSYQTMEFSVS